MAGGDGVDGGANVAAMCLVCGTNQANLTQHLARHSKEEIIRAVTHGRPLPELVPRRGPGRPRRPSFPSVPVTTLPPVTSRPTITSQAPLLLPGNPPPQQSSLGAPVATVPQGAPPPHLSQTQPVKLSSIGPIIQPPRNAVPLAAPLQPCAPGNNYLLIGNNVFPAGSVIPNNLQLSNNGVGYLIPSSGGLVLAAAPSSSQTILVQAPTTSSQTMTVRQQTSPSVSAASGTVVGGIYSNVAHQSARPPLPDAPVCYLDKASHYAPEEMSSSTVTSNVRLEGSPEASLSNSNVTFIRQTLPQTLPQYTGPQKATINIGQNISISLPKDLVGQKDRLKEIINQELVRALLMNESQKNGDSQNQQPSTSGSKKQDITTKTEPTSFDMKNTISITASDMDEVRSECLDENPLSIDSEFCDDDIDIEEEKQDYVERLPDEDPLSTLVIPVPSKCRNDPDYHDSSSIHIEPNVPSPARNITIESDLDNNFINQYNIPVDQPMEVVFTEKGHCSRTTSDSHGSQSGLNVPNDRNTYNMKDNKVPPLTGSSFPEGNRLMELKQAQMQKREVSSNVLNMSNGHSSGLNGNQGSNSANHSKQTNRGGQDQVVGCDTEQQLFMASDRTLNTLLGDSALQEMVYVEEQVLGAVEEVFAGEHSPNLPSTSSAVNGTSNQKSQIRKVTHSYINSYEHHRSSSSQVQDNQLEEKNDVKCKIEPQGSSSQASSSSTNRTSQVTQVPSNHSVIRSAIHIGGKVEPTTHEQEEEMVDDPSLSDNFGNDNIFHDDQMFERELSNQQTEEVMSLKASETLADSDSERATPHEELPDLMFYDRSCMFAGEPGPANLSPRTYPTMESSAFQPLAPAMITPLDNTVQIEPSQTMGGLMTGHTEVVELSSSETTMHITTDILPPEGLSITQLFPHMPQTDPLATDPPVPSTSAPTHTKVMMADLMEESKFSSKVNMDTTPGFSVRSFCSLQSAINHIQENPVPEGVDTIDIIQIPPDVDELTDEEDFDDDFVDDFRNPSFVASEVNGTVEVHQFCKSNTEDSYDSEITPPPKKYKKTVKNQNVTWKKTSPYFIRLKNTADGAEKRTDDMKTKLKGMSNVELFENFFSEELFESIANQSVIYASQKNKHDFLITTNCIRKFFGILLYSGYHKLPSELHYWNSDEQLGMDVRNAMPRNRYTEIKRYIHFTDNKDASQNKEDRAFKIRPIIDYLNDRFKAFGIFSRELAVDEQIIRYYGKHGLRQVIHGKPVRFGFKQYALCCGNTGYCFQMDLYQGKEKRKAECSFEETLGDNVVLDMIRHLRHHDDHEIYVDKILTSHKFLTHMTELGIRLTGTTCTNRTAKCPLQNNRELKSNGRGTYDYGFDEKNEVLFVKWHDDSIVTVGSNHQSINPLGIAKRWCRKEKKEVSFPQPYLISKYNKYKGGVSHLDWLIQKYRIGVRCKKWYFSLFTNCIDTAVVNAWIISVIVTGSQTPLIEFKHSIVRHYLQISSPSMPKQIENPHLYWLVLKVPQGTNIRRQKGKTKTRHPT